MTDGAEVRSAPELFDVAQLVDRTAPPPLFAPGAPLFWDDPHISAQMLHAHLDPDSDAASRRPATISRTVDWLAHAAALHPGDRLLDLGCGPGLYCERFAAHGLHVVGIDYSRRSIAYAREQAQHGELAISYILADYTSAEYPGPFDAAVLIYGDLCTLSDTGRDAVLARLHRSLAPGGYFAFDVMTPQHRQRFVEPLTWTAQQAGFWRPSPYLLLKQIVDYPDEEVYLVRYFVVEGQGRVAEYRIWNRLYTPARIETLLRRFGFRLEWSGNDLAGAPYTADTEWIGVLCRRD